MNCPKCGNRPVTFLKWLGTFNPFRLQCRHCQTRLTAGFTATAWSLLQLPLGVGLCAIYLWLDHAGLVTSSWKRGTFWTGAAAIFFVTAYVIPYLAFQRAYRIAPTTT